MSDEPTIWKPAPVIEMWYGRGYREGQVRCMATHGGFYRSGVARGRRQGALSALAAVGLLVAVAVRFRRT